MSSDTRGIASIEFAVIMPVILLILLGTYDVGGFVLQEMKLAEAANAGGQSAISYPPSDTAVTPSGQGTGMNAAYLTQAIQAALPQGWTVGVDVTVISSMTCLNGCAPPPERVVTIQLTRPFTPLLPLFSGVLTSTSATDVVRVQ